MPLFEKFVIGFLIVWGLMLVSALLVHGIRGDKDRIPRSFWINWGNVFMLSLMQLVRLHPRFLHAHLGILASVVIAWSAVLLWNFWDSTEKRRREEIANGTHQVHNDWAKPDKP